MARLTATHATELRAVKDLCYGGLDSARLREKVGDRLTRHLGLSSYCFGATDPATALPVHSVSVGLDPEAMQAFYRLVLATPSLDFAPWVSSGRRVSRLEDLVDDVDRDPYTTEILRPSGLGPDLQAACAAGGWSWGHLCLRRSRGDRPFAGHELRLIDALVPHLTAGLRAAALRAAQEAPAGADEGSSPAGRPARTGIVILGPDGRVELANGEAERLFRQPVSGTRHSLLTAIHIVVARLERTLADDGGTGIDAPTGGGPLPQLLFSDEASRTVYRLRAEQLLGADGRRRGLVTIEPASAPVPSEQVELLARFGLSRRECEVAVAVVQGRSTAEIAAEAHLSAHTVTDHLRRVYDKVGVSSRQQLALRLLGA